MRVRCLKNRSGRQRHELTVGGEYEVIGIEADWFRVINDAGEPVLFEPILFKIVDATRPANWVTRVVDGAVYAYAKPFGQPGFWEDYHEMVPAARKAFTRYLNRHFRLTDAA